MDKPLLIALSATYALVAFSDVTSIMPSLTLHALIGTSATILLALILIAVTGWRLAIHLILGLGILTMLDALTQIGYMERPSAWLLSPNYLGSFALFSIFLALYERPPAWLFSPSLAANAISLMLSQSRGAEAGLLFGLLFYTKGKWRWLWAIVPMAFIAIVISHGGQGAGERWYNWFIGIHDFIMKPWFGWGQNSPHTSAYARFYNIGIDWLVSAGAIGTVGALICLTMIWKRADRNLRALLVAYLTNGMFIYDTPESTFLLTLAIASLFVNRNVAKLAVFIDHDKAFAVDAAALGSSRERLRT